MDVTIDTEGRSIALSGRLDISSVADVRTALQRAVDAGRGPLIIDLAGVEVVDATGLGALMAIHRRALRADRSVVLRSVPERLGRLLHATRLDRVLTVEPETANDLV